MGEKDTKVDQMKLTVKQLKGLVKEAITKSRLPLNHKDYGRVIDAICSSLVLDGMNMWDADDWTYDRFADAVGTGPEAQQIIATLKNKAIVDKLISAWFKEREMTAKKEYSKKLADMMENLKEK